MLGVVSELKEALQGEMRARPFYEQKARDDACDEFKKQLVIIEDSHR